MKKRYRIVKRPSIISTTTLCHYAFGVGSKFDVEIRVEHKWQFMQSFHEECDAKKFIETMQSLPNDEVVFDTHPVSLNPRELEIK